MPGDISINEIISNALSHRDLAVHEAEQKKREMWEKIPELGRIDNIPYENRQQDNVRIAFRRRYRIKDFGYRARKRRIA